MAIETSIQKQKLKRKHVVAGVGKGALPNWLGLLLASHLIEKIDNFLVTIFKLCNRRFHSNDSQMMMFFTILLSDFKAEKTRTWRET